MNKKYIFSVSAVTAVLLLNTAGSAQAAASYVEFRPKSQQAQVVIQAKPISDNYVRSIVFDTLSQLISAGAFNQPNQQTNQALPVANGNSYDEDATPFAPVYIPAAVLPGTGSLFTATQVSADTATIANASLGATEAESLSVEGGTTLADASIESLNVGALTSASGAYLSEGGDWVNASSKDLKDNFVAVNFDDILEKISSLPIFTWNYKSEDKSVVHMGPVAEDFHAVFSLGGEKGAKAISTVDPAGVALAGVQALAKKVKKLEERPRGMVISDRATGEPMCIYTENGVLKSEPGDCSIPAVAEPQPASAPEPEAEASVQESEQPATIPEEAVVAAPETTITEADPEASPALSTQTEETLIQSATN